MQDGGPKAATALLIGLAVLLMLLMYYGIFYLE